MSLHRLHFDDAEWRPHPFAVAVYIAGVALLAWSVYAYSQMPSGQGGVGPQAEPWRPAASKWSRVEEIGGQHLSAASTSVDGALPAAAPSPRRAPE